MKEDKQKKLKDTMLSTMRRKQGLTNKPIAFYHLKQIVHPTKQNKRQNNDFLNKCCCFTQKIQQKQKPIITQRSELLKRLATQNFTTQSTIHKHQSSQKLGIKSNNQTFNLTKNQSRLTTQISHNSKRSYCAMVIQSHFEKNLKKEKQQMNKKQDQKTTKRNFIKVQSKDFKTRNNHPKQQCKTENIRFINLGKFPQTKQLNN